jgi:diadenosine tetraphosphate (Ap4A) HIT family hydrolase
MPNTPNFPIHSALLNSSVELAQLPLSTLLLVNDSQFPWLILVPRKADISEIYELEWEDQQQLMNESSLIAEMMMMLFEGDKMNIAAIGNICPQLHLHHVVRYKNDLCWPDPIWGKHSPVSYDDQQLQEITQKILDSLAHIFNEAV